VRSSEEYFEILRNGYLVFFFWKFFLWFVVSFRIWLKPT
jgi:hypothetical protein